MKWFGLFGRSDKVEGELGYLGLGPWWLVAFTQAERERIEACYRPTPNPRRPRPLTQGKLSASYHTPVGLLAEIGERLVAAGELDLARRIYVHAEQVGQSSDDALDLHLLYQSLILALGKPTDLDAASLSLQTETCRKQIAMAPAAIRRYRQSYPHYRLPGHVGYTYLTGVYEVEGSFDAAIRLAEEAERQGWAGDWDKRIVRCRRKATGEIPSGLGEDPFRLPPQSRGALGSPAT